MPESVIINFMYQHCFLRNRINLLTVLISFLQSHFLPFLSRVNIIMCSHSTWVLPAVKFMFYNILVNQRVTKKVSKKIRKNSYIYLDVMDKLSTFAPALLERQSLMIDILLMIKGSENKNKKLRKKFGCYLKKSLSLHPLS